MRYRDNVLRFALLVAMLAPLAGCSTLGFAPYPVAHVMTRDTKEVLGATPSQPGVARELSKQSHPLHALQPGDQILLEIVSESSLRLPADQRVMADGTLDLGRFGRVIVAGLTIEETEHAIDRVLASNGTDERVNVRLIEPIHSYYVIGEVNSPGAYPLTGHETVLDAIMEAGGLTPRASACNILLARPTEPCSCRVTLPICYRSITQLGDTTTNYHLQPGDRVFVARQSMMEESFSWLCGSKSCERCEKCQVACRDANVANQASRPFVVPSEIVVPAASAQGLLPPASIYPPSANTQSALTFPESTASPESNDTDGGRSNDEQPLDGELEFGELLEVN